MTKSKEISPWWDRSLESDYQLSCSSVINRCGAPPEGALGFVYVIKAGKRSYIGCKKLVSNRTLPPLKGQKRKRKVQKPSDWVTYCGSSKKLLADIKAGAKVERTILYWAYSKSELAYVELRLQMATDALRSPDFYNGILNVRLPVLKLKDDYYKAYQYALSHFSDNSNY